MSNRLTLEDAMDAMAELLNNHYEPTGVRYASQILTSPWVFTSITGGTISKWYDDTLVEPKILKHRIGVKDG